MRIALTFNEKRSDAEREAEYDSLDTIHAIARMLAHGQRSWAVATPQRGRNAMHRCARPIRAMESRDRKRRRRRRSR